VADPTALRLGVARATPSVHSPAEPILTPCIGICMLDDAGYCAGCRRTGDEIAAWPSMTAAEREHLMNDVLPRREAGSL
jgi:predicted Fe-S protein YdhL (DUF1289 family)